MIDIAPLPNKEAQAFWKDKVPMSPGEFRRLSDEAKTRAFAVSGIAKGDELATVMAAMQKAIDQGTTLADFKKDCAAVFEKRGWTGKRAWRIDNIFRTNIQTAYSVGRYKQMQSVRDRRPYWQYSAVNDKRTRPAHAAMHGKVYPADHPFWATWYPPNGFRCRCGVVTLSARDVADEKLTVETADPTGKLIEPVDPVTGNKLPARLLMPDPGFAHNPGKSVWGGIVDAQTKPAKWESLPGLRTAADYARAPLADVDPAVLPSVDQAALLPAGQSDAYYKSAFVRLYGEEKALTDVLGDPVILSLRAFLQDKTPGAPEIWKFSKDGHGPSIPLLEDILVAPYEVWLTPQRDTHTGAIRLTRRYIALWKTKEKNIGGLGVYEVAGGVFQGVTNFLSFKKGTAKPNITYLEKQREGLLLYPKKKGK